MVKKTNNEKKKNSMSPKKQTVIVLVSITVLLVSYFMLFVPYFEKKKFQNIEKEKNILVSKLDQYIKNDTVYKRSNNSCFKTEQGPFDNGKLWCQTSTEIALVKDIDYKVLEESISQNNTSEDDTKCKLFYKSEEGKEFGSIVRLPKEEPKTPYLIVGCANRAQKAQY